jgi:predicted transcriptional regulator of viral defense system
MTDETAGPATLIRRSDALAGGFSDNDLRRARHAGVLVAIAPGVYAMVGELRGLDAADRHRVVVSAVVPRLVGRPVVGHLSAAILHGLPVECDSTEPVHVIKPSPAKSRRGPVVQVHRSLLLPQEVTSIGGLPVTPAARTVVDCAHALPFDAAVRLARAALEGELVSAADLRSQLPRQRRVPGGRRVAAVVELAVA